VDERPLWRRMFEAWDKQVGPRLEEFVRTEEFADRVALLERMNRRAAEMAEGFTRQVLRFWNLPSATDLDRLNRQLAAIDRQLRNINKTLGEVQDGDDRS
jgi:hypothetical protein